MVWGGGDSPPREPSSDGPHDDRGEDDDHGEQHAGNDQCRDRVREGEISEADDEHVFAEAERPVGHRLGTRVRNRTRARLGEMTSGSHSAAEQRGRADAHSDRPEVHRPVDERARRPPRA